MAEFAAEAGWAFPYLYDESQAVARAYGAAGEAVTTAEAFPAALERALEAGRPALLDLHVDPEWIAPGLSLSALRRR